MSSHRLKKCKGVVGLALSWAASKKVKLSSRIRGYSAVYQLNDDLWRWTFLPEVVSSSGRGLCLSGGS